MRNLIESDEFDLARTLIDEPAKADAKFEELFCRIAIRAESFPVYVYPNERMATIKNSRQIISVFFRILPTTNQVEFLRLLLKTV
ncbi:MAG TPA: hypothetical protein VIK59_01590 [Verrucomicrobiae bacterium]